MKMYGKSDKANSPQNRNQEFQDGYAKGMESLAYNGRQVIAAEDKIRKKVGDDLGAGFVEFKRGFWASRSQYAAMGVKKRRKNM